jgi:hypothetical protein
MNKRRTLARRGRAVSGEAGCGMGALGRDATGEKALPTLIATVR